LTGSASTAGSRVVVVGGGLAGIAAALECADGGCTVTLIERRRRLGGLTWSLTHNERSYDNGQHVFLRCCDEYLAFLRRIQAFDDVAIQPHLEIPVLCAGHRPAFLRRGRLPAPVHLGPSLLRYPHLSVGDKARLGLAAIPLSRLDLDDPALDQVTFGDWLTEHRQSQRAQDALWDLICLATINVRAAQASLVAAAKVFQVGLFGEASAADIGWSKVPLGVLHGDRAQVALARSGVTVLEGHRVTELLEADQAGMGLGNGLDRGHELGGRWRIRTGIDQHQGPGIEADTVILAVAHTTAEALLPPGSLPPSVQISKLGLSPILNVHVTYDRPVTDLAFAAVLDSTLQWVFDRTGSSGCRHTHPASQCLTVSLSAAEDLMSLGSAQLTGRIVSDLGAVFPRAVEAQVIDTLVTREPSATFRAVPGTAAHRPGCLTTRPGLLLAGAWTATGWPATMESAVRSGLAAARSAVGRARAHPLPAMVALTHGPSEDLA